jgi:cell division protein FtsB
MKPRLKLALLLAAGAGALLFAVQGGEWTTTALLRQRGQIKQLEVSIGQVKTTVDSLKLYKKRLETDPKLQEKIAREEFGMIRNGEILYRFVDSIPK